MDVVLALLPFVIAIIMLAILQRSGLQAGLVTLAAGIAIVIAIPAFRLTPNHLLTYAPKYLLSFEVQIHQN